MLTELLATAGDVVWALRFLSGTGASEIPSLATSDFAGGLDESDGKSHRAAPCITVISPTYFKVS